MKQETGLRTIKRRQLVDEVINQLEELIAFGDYKIGTKIPTEPELMAKLGVSRTTIREAVRVLSNTGLLEVRQGDGTYVRAYSTEVEPFERRLRRANILEVYEARQLLEAELAKLAAIRRTEEDLIVMKESLKKRIAAQESLNMEDYVESDIAFHKAIAVASKNSVLADLYLGFSNVVRGGVNSFAQAMTPSGCERILDSHQRLLQAIEDQNIEEARKWAVETLDKIINQLKVTQ